MFVDEACSTVLNPIFKQDLTSLSWGVGAGKVSILHPKSDQTTKLHMEEMCFHSELNEVLIHWDIQHTE